MGAKRSNIAHLATITSRPHALVIASALEHEGIPVWIDGLYHASVDPLSVALGGHRLTIPAEEHVRASALVREIGLPEAEIAFAGQKLAVQKLLAFWLGFQFFWAIPATIMGAIPAGVLLLVPLNTLTYLPVDPRGQNDFHLLDDREA